MYFQLRWSLLADNRASSTPPLDHSILDHRYTLCRGLSFRLAAAPPDDLNHHVPHGWLVSALRVIIHPIKNKTSHFRALVSELNGCDVTDPDTPIEHQEHHNLSRLASMSCLMYALVEWGRRSRPSFSGSTYDLYKVELFPSRSCSRTIHL